jgi:hypothetical protein
MTTFRIEERGGWLTTCGGRYGSKEPGGAEYSVPGNLVVGWRPGFKVAEGGEINGDSALAVIR